MKVTKWRLFLHYFGVHTYGPWSEGVRTSMQSYWMTRDGVAPYGQPYPVLKQIRTCLICGETEVRYLDV